MPRSGSSWPARTTRWATGCRRKKRSAMPPAWVSTAPAPLLNNLAWTYQQDKDPRALETAELALKQSPNSASVMDTLGWLLVEPGNTARGLPLLKKAVELAPKSTELRFHLAAALNKSGDKLAARKELEK